MIRPYASTSRTRLGSRVAANNAPQAAPYSTTSSPYGSPPARAPQAGPRPPDVRQAAQAPAQGVVGRVDTGRSVMPPSLPRSAFAPNMGRQPETPPSTRVQPQQGWSASNDKEDPIWRNTWRSHGEGVWGANADANSGGYPMPPGMRPANIDQTRLQPPPDYGLTATRRNPQMIWPAEVEPQDDGVPTGQEAPITLRGGQGPAGSPPPPDDGSGIGVSVSGLTEEEDAEQRRAQEVARRQQQEALEENARFLEALAEYASRPENQGRDKYEVEAEFREKWAADKEAAFQQEQQDAYRESIGGDDAEHRTMYHSQSDDDLRARIEELSSDPWIARLNREEIESYQKELDARAASRARASGTPPTAQHNEAAAKGTGLSPEQIAADHEEGYRWAVDPETGEWRRYNFKDMLTAFQRMYTPGENARMDAIWQALREGKMPSMSDVELAMLEYNSDEEVLLWGKFKGKTRAELEADGVVWSQDGQKEPASEGDWWSDEFSALYESLMDELNKEWEPFDDGALKQASALDRSQQMRAALEMASAQGASTGQVQSALSDIGLRSESQLNSQVAEGNMASQIAKAQRNAGMIAQAISILNAQMANATSREEAEANRELQMRLTQMGIAQQNRMDRIQAERDRNRTFWDSLGGAFGGLLGLGGQLGGAYLGRPSF